MLQAPRAWLDANLASNATDGSWWYRGNLIQSRCLLRLRQPQVCITCLHLRGCCLALWDLSCVTACPLHGRRLVDRCSKCGASLTWDRPAADVCRCGSILQTVPSEAAASEFSRLLASAIDAHLRSERPSETLFESIGVAGYLAELSLSGLMTVVQAFGEMAEPHEWVGPSAIVRGRATAQWIEIVDRAEGRLRRFAQAEEPNSPLAGEVSKTLLRRLLSRPLSVADVQVGRLMHNRLFGPLGNKFGRLTGQMELFS